MKARLANAQFGLALKMRLIHAWLKKELSMISMYLKGYLLWKLLFFCVSVWLFCKFVRHCRDWEQSWGNMKSVFITIIMAIKTKEIHLNKILQLDKLKPSYVGISIFCYWTCLHFYTTVINTNRTLSPPHGQLYTCLCWHGEGYRTCKNIRSQEHENSLE